MILKAQELDISGGYVFELQKYADDRGEYVETWNENDYLPYLPEGVRFKQDDFSRSWGGVLRGLHGDNQTWKLIQCIYGTLQFVMFDINTHQTFQTVLSSHQHRTYQQILVPPQCANGHLCLSNECIFMYKQSTLYGETKQFTVKYNDPLVKATWPPSNQLYPRISPILSKRDSEGPFIDFGGRN